MSNKLQWFLWGFLSAVFGFLIATWWSGGSEQTSVENDDQLNLENIATEENLRNDAKRARFNSIFEDESRDNSWASEVETKINAIFNTEIFADSALIDVACAQTLCRITMNHNDTGSMEGFLERFILFSPPNAGGWWQVPNDSKPLHSILYLARENSDVLLSVE